MLGSDDSQVKYYAGGWPTFAFLWQMWVRERPESRISPCPLFLCAEPLLTAPARAAAAHAAVAASVAGHDGAADRATGGVAHVDQLFQRVGGVVMSRHSSPRN